MNEKKPPADIRKFNETLRGLMAVPKSELDAKFKARKKRPRKKK